MGCAIAQADIKAYVDDIDKVPLDSDGDTMYKRPAGILLESVRKGIRSKNRSKNKQSRRSRKQNRKRD